MPPTLYLVRHGEGEHNLRGDNTIRDPLLTTIGRFQCAELEEIFPYHTNIDLVLVSPLKRTIQTATIAFRQILLQENNGVPLKLVPRAREVSDYNCDLGQNLVDLQAALPSILPPGLDATKLDFGLWDDAWNSTTGYWKFEPATIQRRAVDLRNWLFSRPEAHIVLVTHGGFLHYLTEDWSDFEPTHGTGWRNCEFRRFSFTPGSISGDAHMVLDGAIRDFAGLQNEKVVETVAVCEVAAPKAGI